VTNERSLSEDDVRDEHLANISQGAHWVYLFGVIIGSMLVMVALIALLGGGGG
jgi:hypothetical protein